MKDIYLEEDEFLNFNCLFYTSNNENEELFCFSEMSTLQVAQHIPYNLKISSIEIFVDIINGGHKLSEDYTDFKYLKDFIEYFNTNKDELIHDLTLVFDNGFEIGSHDDGEVSLKIKKGSNQIDYIGKILNHYNLKVGLIDTMKANMNKYIEIDKSGNTLNVFDDFDEYIRHLTNK